MLKTGRDNYKDDTHFMKTTAIESGDQRVERRLAAPEMLTSRRDFIPGYAQLARFFVLVVQFGLIVLLVQYWHLESQQLTRLMWLAFVGFIIHHLLPLRFRLPFFAVLSLAAVITGVGHLGPNVFTGWVGGRMTTANFLYHL